MLRAISWLRALLSSYHCRWCGWYSCTYCYPRSISPKFNFSFHLFSLLCSYMRHIVILISMIYLLTSCTTQRYETIEIIGKDSQNGWIVVLGMGVKISDDSILTSAHVVRDDRFVYEISGIRYQVSERDIMTDRAILMRYTSSKNQTKIPKLQLVNLWDPIYTEVSRSGSIMRITGKVVDPSGSVTGYDMTWRVVTLSGIVLTDIELQPGDSGAPIFTTQWQIVDVVHVR